MTATFTKLVLIASVAGSAILGSAQVSAEPPVPRPNPLREAPKPAEDCGDYEGYTEAISIMFGAEPVVAYWSEPLERIVEVWVAEDNKQNVVVAFDPTSGCSKLLDTGKGMQYNVGGILKRASQDNSDL